jgi:hypothetical protein
VNYLPSRAVPCALALVVICAFAPVGAQTVTAPANDGGHWSRWFERSERAKAEQPHWITPIATTTPRLEQEFRYDLSWSQARAGAPNTENFGNTKGLELIPFDRVEIIAGVPGYVVHNNATVPNGWADASLLVKYRIVAAPEETGSYILSAFLGTTFPTATNHNGQAKAIITPTLAYGEGWNLFDMQGTISVTEPVADAAIIGHTYTWNHTFQLHAQQRLWPELEVNQSWFSGGRNAGKAQTFLTPGIVLGRLPITDRVGLTLGAGVQVAVSQFHTSNHNTILSMRFPF